MCPTLARQLRDLNDEGVFLDAFGSDNVRVQPHVHQPGHGEWLPALYSIGIAISV